MLTCFIGTYRFNLKYFCWRAGSKVLPCNPSTSQLSATFRAQAQVASQSPDTLLGQGAVMGFLCGRRANLYTSVMDPSLPQSPNPQHSGALCSLCCPSAASGIEGGCGSFTSPCWRLAGEVTEKADLCPCSVLHGSNGKGIIIAARMLHRWGFSLSLIRLCWVSHKLEKTRLTYSRHSQYMQSLPHSKTVSSKRNRPFIPIIYSEVITKSSKSQFPIS